MTCVVVIKDSDTIVMGADRSVLINDEIYINKHPKIFTVKNMLIGVSGDWRGANLIQYSMNVPNIENVDEMQYLVGYFVPSMQKIFRASCYTSSESCKEFCDSRLLVVINSRIFRIGADYSVTEFEDGYAAIGTGAPYALGSIFSTIRENASSAYSGVLEALRAAEKFDKNVRAPFDIEIINLEKTISSKIPDLDKKIKKVMEDIKSL